MAQKLLYTAPMAELLVVRFEEHFLLSGGEPGDPGAAGGDFSTGLGGNFFEFDGLL